MSKKKLTPGALDKRLPTVKQMNKYRGASIGLKCASYGCCLVPAGVIVGVNWNDWFAQADDGKVSIGLGFGMLIVSTLLSVIMVMKRDKEFMKKYSPMFYVALLVLCWGATFALLSALAKEFASMLIYVGIGVACGAICDEVNIAAIKPRYEKYKKLVFDYGLVDKAQAEINAREQAKKDREARRTWHPVE